MVSSIAPLLARAHEALSHHRPADALVPLIDSWRAVRSDELAELIDQLSDQLRPTRPPILGATQAELETRWYERAEQADAVDVGILLTSLTETNSHQARRRLKLLAHHAPDPRLASALASVVMNPPFVSSSTAKFWQTLHQILIACADPRALARLEAAPALEPNASATQLRLDGARRRTAEVLRAELNALTTTADTDDLAQIAQIATILARASDAQQDRGPELLAAILDDPADLDRRQVYADYLLEIGDVRGEFIALQLADGRGTLDRPGQIRMRKLQREHGNLWLGKLRRLIVSTGTQFCNGFVSALRIKQSHHGLDELLDDPIWATIETLEFPPLELVLAPMVRSLRSLRWSPAQLLKAAMHESLSLPAITQLAIATTGWERTHYSRQDRDDAVRRALELPMFTNLQRLLLDIYTGVEFGRLAWLWKGPLAGRLTHVELRLEQDVLGLAGFARSFVRADPRSRLTELVVANQALRCRFVRTDHAKVRAELTLGADPSSTDITTELRSLADVANIEVELGPGLQAG